MPVITDIRQQSRRTDRYSIYLDKRYAFSLSELELSSSGLRRGRELSDGDVEYWRRQSGEGKAYDAALKYLGYRARSVREISDHLRRKGYETEVVEGIIGRLIENKFLDDAQFAAQWVKERQIFRPRSRRVLEQELIQKGVNREIIQDTLAAVGDEGHEQMLNDLIAKKRRQARYQDDEKLMAYLARQGFGYDQIKKALTRLDD